MHRVSSSALGHLHPLCAVVAVRQCDLLSQALKSYEGWSAVVWLMDMCLTYMLGSQLARDMPLDPATLDTWRPHMTRCP